MDIVLLQRVVGDKTTGGGIQTRGHDDLGTSDIVRGFLQRIDNVDHCVHIHKAYQHALNQFMHRYGSVATYDGK